jgi:signal transduction histidine kinase
MPVRPATRGLAGVLRGVRARSTAAAVLVVAVALAVAAATFVLLLQRTLISTAQQAATSRAADVAGQLRDQGLAQVRSSLPDVRAGQVVQVVDAAGDVVATSSRRALDRPLTTVRAADGETRPVRASSLPLLDDDDPYLLVVAGSRSAGQLYEVVVATPTAAAQQSVETALSLLVLGLPVLLLLVGAATWRLVGLALAPVERIRAQVARIGGGTRVSERIPVPATQDEIARLASTMNEMLARLEQGQRTQRQFVADASHELRSPLATLSASLEVAVADRDGESWRDLSPLMGREVERMGRLVQDLLLLAKVDEHTMRLDLEDVDLDDLVEDGRRRLSAQPQLRVQTHVAPARVIGDRSRLGRVVSNLTDNAAQHAVSLVRLELGPDGPSDAAGVLLVVDDDGAGVPPADRERVFERFVRLDDSRERSSGGSGLGLAIVREVVTAHGGSVRIGESDAGGCRVEVRLPAAPPGEPVGAPAAQSERT